MNSYQSSLRVISLITSYYTYFTQLVKVNLLLNLISLSQIILIKKYLKGLNDIGLTVLTYITLHSTIKNPQ